METLRQEPLSRIQRFTKWLTWHIDLMTDLANQTEARDKVNITLSRSHAFYQSLHPAHLKNSMYVYMLSLTLLVFYV